MFTRDGGWQASEADLRTPVCSIGEHHKCPYEYDEGGGKIWRCSCKCHRKLAAGVSPAPKEPDK